MKQFILFILVLLPVCAFAQFTENLMVRRSVRIIRGLMILVDM